MGKNNGRDKSHDQVEDNEREDDAQDTRDDEENVRVVYVREHRRGPMAWFRSASDRFHRAGQRWVELSVDRPLKNQDKLPGWVHTTKGRWILVGIVVAILVGWMVLFGLVS